MNERRKIVVGGTHQRFLEWCRDNDISPLKAIYAGDDHRKVMGLEFKESDIVRLGGSSWEMELALRTRIR